ncbi:MAG: N-acetylglucosamine-6-phosphate deacetylase [Bacilli bacterium]|nr:N-acetylglucosamine-6-phosphate deacetylase [Bacilli bacterium]
MISFKSANVYLNNKKIVRTSLVIKGNKFSSLRTSQGITLSNKYFIVPGFIEEHIHGANASDTMDATKDALHNIATSITQSGTTSFLPTTMTMSKASIKKALTNIKKKQYAPNEAKILGVHLEGPFISEVYRGAQDKKYIVKPNISLMKDFINASGNKIKIVTLAIEKSDMNFIKFLKKNRIVISVGHSNATFSEVKKYQNDINCFTHTYNAMSKLHHRDIGVTGAALTLKDMYAELILDLKHVSQEAAQLLFNNKGKNKLVLITDSMEGRYMKSGKYHLGTFPVYVKNGYALLKDGQLAGSVLTTNEALRNAKKIFNLKLEEAVDLVSKNVANNLHLKNVGEIKIGNDADFVIIDQDFNVYQTYVNGKLVYSKKNFLLTK